MKLLHIGKKADGSPMYLPADLGDCKIAQLAMSKAGKTYGLGDILEELCKAQRPFIAVDPASNLWGLRSKPDGHPSRLPVVVIGGPHGDIPLEKDAGERIAEALLTEPICAVIDVAFESKTTTRHFITNLCNRLMRTRSDVSRVFVVEEAPEFVPQRASYQGIQVCKAAVEQILRVGGNFGYGAIVASQRSATIDKDVLSQCEALIVMRLTGAADRKAIKDWIESKNVGEQLDACFDTLASLKDGEAWLWWPTQDRFDRFTFRKRETLHPREMKKLGLTTEGVALGDSQAFVDRLKVELSKKQVQAAKVDQRGLKISKVVRPAAPSLPYEPAAKVDQSTQEGPEVVQLREQLAGERRGRAEVERKLNSACAKITAVRRQLQPQYDALRALFSELGDEAAGAVDRGVYEPWLLKAGQRGCRRMLEILIERQNLTRNQLGTLSGVPAGKSTFRAYLGWLRANGLIETEGETVKLRAV